VRDGVQQKQPTAPSAVVLLAANVLRLREQGRWSARAFAQHAGVGRNTLRAIEAGEEKVKGIELGTVEKLARALGVDASSLFSEGQETRPWIGAGSIEQLGAAIQKARRRRGLTQDELAALAQIPRETLTRVETRAGVPTLSTLARISEALGVPLRSLLENSA
jgi:transcriptional regulator with XRE-family HTH domain